MGALPLSSVLLILPGLLAAQSQASVVRAVNSITPEDVRRRIGIIADDSMRGRDTPSPELEEVANYITGEFHRFGLAPAGDSGTFIQRYEVVRQQPDTAASRLAVTGPTSARLRLGAEALVLPFFPAPIRDLAGPVVLLAGPPDSGDPLGGVDVRGAWVVLPATASATRDLGLQFDGRSAEEAVQAGAMGVVLVSNRPDTDWAALAIETLQPTLELQPPGGEAFQIAVLEVRDGVAARALGVNPAALRAFPTRVARRLAGVSIAFRPRYHVYSRIRAPNVVGILEGSDPQLKNEYVVFSAHMDHKGVDRPVNGDSIFNGADDDASGTVAVVEEAEAFAQLRPRPKRSIIFLTVSGEEKELWGSAFFTSHFPVPVASIVADLNIDMVGRNWKDTIVAIGKEHSDLGATLNRVAAAHPELHIQPIDDIWPEQGFYRRSDHFNFARRGIPILFFFNGTHPDYHERGDSPDKIDAEKESRIVKLVFYLGLEVANRTERPQWNPASYQRIVGGAR